MTSHWGLHLPLNVHILQVIRVASQTKWQLQDKPGKKVGVVGLGGLGHMAVKLAKAFGCKVCGPGLFVVRAMGWGGCEPGAHGSEAGQGLWLRGACRAVVHRL